ncbi:MAG: glycoside hydrolase family 2 protein, partial [Crocinitomicaceae bacterium]|nr:glycoside hydrolase family 2 protein [Crocinitomicaceae bacterium]
MRFSTLIALSILSTLGAAQPMENSTGHIFPLNAVWKFAEADSSNWNLAAVPGCVHTDLLRNGLIPDPFSGTNELHCQWIGERDWVYETEPFSIDEKTLRNDIVRIR